MNVIYFFVTIITDVESDRTKNLATSSFDIVQCTDTDDFTRIKAQISEVFSEEIAKENPIFLRVAPSVVTRLAMFLSGRINRPASVGIAGETASGKSTITFDIINTINTFSQKFYQSSAITRVNADDYYYDRSEMVKKAGSFAEFAKEYDLDSPDAIELELMKQNILELVQGKSTYLPKYDMSGTAIRYDNHTLAEPSKIIISEGLFVLNKKIADAFDFKIYVQVSENVKRTRFYARAQERDLANSADDVYKNACKKASIHILPTIESADIVLSGESDRRRYVEVLDKILNIVRGYSVETLCISRDI